MTKLDPVLEVIRTTYGLEEGDFWQLPQKKGTWLVKHAALEVVAAKSGIIFELPQVLEADSSNGLAVVCVRGTLDTHSEWSIGEASPKNSHNAYPWAMAEKRAKDRVILKLIGIHGLVYSEDEMADAHDPPPTRHAEPEPEPEMANTAAKQHWKTIADDMFAAATLRQLKGVWERHYPIYERLPENLRRELDTWKDELKDKLMAAEEASAKPRVAVAPNFDRQPGEDA